ncbi:hypothetical protein DOY81_006569 [Sarcophaga bullata]|nr:hypothetical protein DOY81_006569 [Sarcophaga bullata]
MVGKIHKKKISEYTEAAENDDKQSDRGDEADEMILDHVEPVPSGSESENGDNANNEHNKSSDSVNANDDAGKFLAKMKSQENVSFKELREEPKKTKRLVNETAPRTNIHNPIGRKSKRAITKKRVFYGDMDE